MGTRTLALFLALSAVGCGDVLTEPPVVIEPPPPDGRRVLVSEAVRLDPGTTCNVGKLDISADATIQFSVTNQAKQPSGLGIVSPVKAIAWPDISDYSPYEAHWTFGPGLYDIDVGCREEATASCAFDLMVWLADGR